jgi:beta-phosphoglucomutase-like phosphatase (HAD superfamily)
MKLRPQAIIFDFDGVLLESEYEGNRCIAETLTELGHPTRIEDALDHFVGLNGQDFVMAVEQWIGGPLPGGFRERMSIERVRVLRDGLADVDGAVAFVTSLPAWLPMAIASSSSVQWVGTHLAHLGLTDAFGEHIYSGREHVARGKPAPDLYFHAARSLGADIGRTVIIEDSKVGATGALASGAEVIGLTAGAHCLDGHGDMLRALGVRHVAASFDEVRDLLDLG